MTTSISVWVVSRHAVLGACPEVQAVFSSEEAANDYVDDHMQLNEVWVVSRFVLELPERNEP